MVRRREDWSNVTRRGLTLKETDHQNTACGIETWWRGGRARNELGGSGRKRCEAGSVSSAKFGSGRRWQRSWASRGAWRGFASPRVPQRIGVAMIVMKEFSNASTHSMQLQRSQVFHSPVLSGNR